jgi:hypothetical protein
MMAFENVFTFSSLADCTFMGFMMKVARNDGRNYHRLNLHTSGQFLCNHKSEKLSEQNYCTTFYKRKKNDKRAFKNDERAFRGDEHSHHKIEGVGHNCIGTYGGYSDF